MATRVLYATETTDGQNGPVESGDTLVGKSSADISAQVATLTRGTSGAGSLWEDDNVTSITVGGGAANTSIDIGTGSVANTITIGNTTGATGVNLQAGTGGVQVNSLPLPSVLATQTSVDLTSTGSTSLYTVPTGRSAIITGVFIVPTTATTPGGDAVISVGTNSATFDNIVDGEVLTGLDAITELYNVVPGPGVMHLAIAAEVVTFIVDTADTGSALTATIYLLGFEF